MYYILEVTRCKNIVYIAVHLVLTKREIFNCFQLFKGKAQFIFLCNPQKSGAL